MQKAIADDESDVDLRKVASCSSLRAVMKASDNKGNLSQERKLVDRAADIGSLKFRYVVLSRRERNHCLDGGASLLPYFVTG